MIFLLLSLLIFTHMVDTPNLVDSYRVSAPKIVDIGAYEVFVPSPRDIMEQISAKHLHKVYVPPRHFMVRGGGSGIVLRSDGIILTAAHVVSKTNIVRIEVCGGPAYKAVVVARDEKVDLALLKIVPHVQEPLKPVTLGVARPMGWPVYTIGNPRWLRWVITAGVLGTVDDGLYVSDTAIEHGSSGGGLFDARNNRLLGVVVQMFGGYCASVHINDVRRFVESRMALADFVL